jgi:hypothetical protein
LKGLFQQPARALNKGIVMSITSLQNRTNTGGVRAQTNAGKHEISMPLEFPRNLALLGSVYALSGKALPVD